MKKFYYNTEENENLFSKTESRNDFAATFKTSSLPPVKKGIKKETKWRFKVNIIQLNFKLQTI